MKKIPETVLAYIEKDHCFLMLFRNKKKVDINKGKWLGVGGHLEKGETPEQALFREVKEETGYTVKKYEYKGLITFIYDGYTELMYLYHVSEVEGELGECSEGDLKYIPIERVYDLDMWEGDKIFIPYLLEDKPYFELELNYEGNKLVSHRFIK